MMIFSWIFFFSDESILVNYNRDLLSNVILYDIFVSKNRSDALLSLLIFDLPWVYPYTKRVISESSWSEVHGKKY